MVEINGSRILRSLVDASSPEEQHPERGVIACFNHLLREHPRHLAIWYQHPLREHLASLDSTPSLLNSSSELLHVGLSTWSPDTFSDLQLVDFTSPYVLPCAAEKRRMTWLASSTVGVAHVDTLLALGGLDERFDTLDAALLDLALRSMPKGLLPYHEPRLLAHSDITGHAQLTPITLPSVDLYRLVVKNFTTRLTRSLQVGRLRYGRWRPEEVRLYRRAKMEMGVSQPVEQPLMLQETNLNSDESLPGVDVVIPTLDRLEPLLNLLEDLGQQDHCPQRVIVVEQLPNGASSILSCQLQQRRFPFELIHLQRQHLGACGSRNEGIGYVRAPYTAILDDDIRLSPGFLRHLVTVAETYAAGAVVGGLYQKGESIEKLPGRFCPIPWPTLGTGSVVVRTAALRSVGGLDERLEGGYGEDYELGLRLQLAGHAVLYSAALPALHLKAPRGGFRALAERSALMPWLRKRLVLQRAFEPKPSPSVLYPKLRWLTPTMRFAYQMHYFFHQIRSCTPWRAVLNLPLILYRYGQAIRWARDLVRQGPLLLNKNSS